MQIQDIQFGQAFKAAYGMDSMKNKEVTELEIKKYDKNVNYVILTTHLPIHQSNAKYNALASQENR